MSETYSFADEIKAHMNAEAVSSEVAGLETEASSLAVRLRGAFITDCELTSPSGGERVAVLYSDTDLTKPKITATHSMIPAGKYDGVTGQHGFPRWVDYARLATDDQQQLVLEAQQSEYGLSLVKTFALTGSSLVSQTQLANPAAETEHTSIGEHYYFALADNQLDGLTVNGITLDELTGADGKATFSEKGTLYWGFPGEAVIKFPAGHSIKLSATFEGDNQYPLALWIWKSSDTPSICFEPIAGVAHLGDADRSGVSLPQGTSASLTTKIELL